MRQQKRWASVRSKKNEGRRSEACHWLPLIATPVSVHCDHLWWQYWANDGDEQLPDMVWGMGTVFWVCVGADMYQGDWRRGKVWYCPFCNLWCNSTEIGSCAMDLVSLAKVCPSLGRFLTALEKKESNFVYCGIHNRVNLDTVTDVSRRLACMGLPVQLHVWACSIKISRNICFSTFCSCCLPF